MLRKKGFAEDIKSPAGFKGLRSTSWKCVLVTNNIFQEFLKIFALYEEKINKIPITFEIPDCPD